MSNKKALIVVDMQNDYLWNRRKKMFSYNTPELVNAVNSLISEFSERDLCWASIPQYYHK